MNRIQKFGEYNFDLSSMLLMRGVQICELSPRQVKVLSILLEADGEVVSREAILNEVWQDVSVEDHNLTQTIFLLRKALGRLPSGHDCIETVPRRGYRVSEAIRQAVHHHGWKSGPNEVSEQGVRMSVGMRGERDSLISSVETRRVIVFLLVALTVFVAYGVLRW